MLPEKGEDLRYAGEQASRPPSARGLFTSFSLCLVYASEIGCFQVWAGEILIWGVLASPKRQELRVEREKNRSEQLKYIHAWGHPKIK